LSIVPGPVIWIGEPEDFSENAKRILEQNAEVICRRVNEHDLGEVFDQCDAFIFRLGVRIQSKDINNKQRCKIIATPVTGLDHIDLLACRTNGIQVISLKGEELFLREVRATAEHTFALLFALIRNIIPAALHVTQMHFDRNLFRGHELYQKIFGIIGYGRLGKIVADYARAFGMKVLVYEIDKKKILKNAEYEFVELNELLTQADYISLHVDTRQDNIHFINREVLSQMKPSAYLINTSRGSLVNESDLVDALENRIISGAALDVVNGEPNPDFDNRLFQYQRNHANLLITPHLGGNTFESFEKTECFIAQKIIDQLTHA
jgi:D-3-phosphoglycerate dehydrogenase